MTNANPSPKIKDRRCYNCGHDRFFEASINSDAKCSRCGRGPSELKTDKNKHGKEIQKIIEVKR